MEPHSRFGGGRVRRLRWRRLERVIAGAPLRRGEHRLGRGGGADRCQGTLSYWAPLRPVLGVLSVGLLATGLFVRLRGGIAYPAPATEDGAARR